MSRPEVETRKAHRRLPMRRPLVSLSIAFAVGILLEDLTGLSILVSWLVAAASALAAGGLALARRGGPSRFLLWLISVAALGCVRGERPAPATAPPIAGKLVLSGSARSGWEHRPDRLRLEAEVLALREPYGKEIPVSARVLLTLLRRQEEKQPDQEAGRCPDLLPGDRLRALARVRLPWTTRNPGVVDHRLRLRRRGIDWTATTASCEDLLVEPRPRSVSVRRWIEDARAGWLRFLLGRDGSPTEKSILAALTVGEQGLVPQPARDSFQAVGLSHLLSISGLHLGFVALGLYRLLLALLVRVRRLVLWRDVRRVAAAAVIPVTLWYTVLAGAQLPAVRACIMVVCFLVAVIIRRESDPLQTLSAAGLIILGAWPQSLFEISFQLSFVSVAFILLGVPVIARWLRLPLHRAAIEEPWCRRLLVRIVDFVLVSLVAMLATAPLAAWHFNQATLVGLLANLLAVPLTAGVIVPLGLAATVLFPLSVNLAGLVVDAAMFLSSALAGLAAGMASWPFSSFQLATPSVVELLLGYGAMLSLLQVGRVRWAGWTALAGGLLLLIFWGVGQLAMRGSDELKITFLDVGQGDSILVRFPGGEALLIDGGESREGEFDAGRFVVAPYLWSQRITRLEAVVVTHPQSDHAGGLRSIVSLFRPREIWTARALEESPVTQPLAEASRAVGAKVRILGRGDRPRSQDGCEVKVVWPARDAPGLEENERSLVLRMVYGKHSFLFTGDLEEQGEAGLLAEETELSANVLKVGHHGSRLATGEKLLSRVRPAFAVISVGEGNHYGFPHPELVDRLKAAGVFVFRTDRHGAVTFAADGEELKVDLTTASGTTEKQVDLPGSEASGG